MILVISYSWIRNKIDVKKNFSCKILWFRTVDIINCLSQFLLFWNNFNSIFHYNFDTFFFMELFTISGNIFLEKGQSSGIMEFVPATGIWPREEIWGRIFKCRICIYMWRDGKMFGSSCCKYNKRSNLSYVTFQGNNNIWSHKTGCRIMQV